jgi:biopolymer transport protein ExbD
MSRLNRRRDAQEDVDIDMVPIMNMFLVLIPFLLLSANFIHLKAINTSVPVQAESSVSQQVEDKAEEKITVTMVVQISGDAIELSAMSPMLDSEVLDELKLKIVKETSDEYPFEKMALFLAGVKEKYPASDTVIVIPHKETLYDTIIQTMDAARRSDEKLLFPNVVLSSKVG